ncbi:MAG: hypothetical protein AAFY20_18445 [Cyanobacteria bacterium J06639_14]
MNYLIAEIRGHAESRPNEEICGAVINGVVVRGKNISDEPRLHFLLDDETTQRVAEAIADGSTAEIYHSHVGKRNDDFTPADIKGAHEWEIPWMLVHTPTGRIRRYDPDAIQPYEGREWHWAYQNCFTLVSDWLRQELGIEVSRFLLESPDAWQKIGWDKFRENLGNEGFSKVEPPIQRGERGDVVLMMLGETRVPNHIGVIVEPSRNKILHHCQNALSRVATYGNSYRKATAGVYRHASRL